MIAKSQDYPYHPILMGVVKTLQSHPQYHLTFLVSSTGAGFFFLVSLVFGCGSGTEGVSSSTSSKSNNTLGVASEEELLMKGGEKRIKITVFFLSLFFL